MSFEQNVFINCPFDSAYGPLLDAIVFCVVDAELTPRLASERLENGENRFDKICGLVLESKYSIHDLSRCKAEAAGDYARMNMPFELGLDFGIRRSAVDQVHSKKFLIFEKDQYETKRTLSDLSGQDIAFHKDDYQKVIKHIRDFFSVEAGLEVPGAKLIAARYATCQSWIMEKKLHEGHSVEDAKALPIAELIREMKEWVAKGRPDIFVP